MHCPSRIVVRASAAHLAIGEVEWRGGREEWVEISGERRGDGGDRGREGGERRKARGEERRWRRRGGRERGVGGGGVEERRGGEWEEIGKGAMSAGQLAVAQWPGHGSKSEEWSRGGES
jgi:hypothetical protein